MGTNAKTALNTFCQRYTNKTIGKPDIVYSNVKFGDQVQSTVTLACIGGAQFAGEVATTEKQAEQNAAKMALENYSAEIASLPEKSKTKNNKRKAPTLIEAVDTAASPTGALPLNNNRVRLNAALGRILKRHMTKEDIQKSTVQAGTGHQCTISLPCLPDQWATMAWAGEVAENAKLAEENAAKHALEALKADATYGPMLEGTAPVAKPAKAQKTGGGAPASMEEMFNMMMKMFGKGKGKGKGKGPSGPKPREQVSATPIAGTVSEWRYGWGWITPSEKVEHEMAEKNKGRIFLHKSDWQGSDQVAVGTSVTFTVYSDSSGLGAENCTPA